MEFERLQSIIAEVMNVEEDSITPETKFVDDLGADSLDIAQIMMAVEDETGIEMDPEEMDGIKSVSDALELIKASM